MDIYSYSSVSVQSSPRSTSETTTGDDDTLPYPNNNYKIKLMCSYGGKIQPRQHDNQLTYVAGDTKIIAVDRNIKFSIFLSKLASLSNLQPNHVCFRYQLPGEDLDALISVTNDEDLEHMMLEYDRLYRESPKPVRLRLFLFPTSPVPSAFSSSDSKSHRQWFVDALNSVQNTNSSHHDSLSSPAVTPMSSATPDFLFGLEKGDHAPPITVPESEPPPIGDDVRRMENRGFVVDESEIQRQVNNLERMQIYNQEQLNLVDGFYSQTPPVNFRQAGVYHQSAGSEQPFYMTPTAGVYQTQDMRPVTGQVGEGYYSMQRMVPEVYREQHVYNVVPQQQQQSLQHKNMAAYTVVGPDHGFAQVGYDGTGRQVYYTTAAGGGVVQPQLQAVHRRQGGGE